MNRCTGLLHRLGKHRQTNAAGEEHALMRVCFAGPHQNVRSKKSEMPGYPGCP